LENFWNEGYSKTEYAYGEEPNKFFAEQLDQIKSGLIILPCEGEGRNAVYAATRGWIVKAFDTSKAGKVKALKLAKKKEVNIEYIVEDALTINYPENSADAVAFIFAHFSPPARKKIHQKAINWLKPGGRIIIEAFNPNQLQNTSGGPKELSMLYTENMIREDFHELKIEIIQTLRTELKEGKYHEGIADVIRFVGVKI
jgi:ubiquinone/menaquinone biosynthesis C-methylase UbiE